MLFSTGDSKRPLPAAAMMMPVRRTLRAWFAWFLACTAQLVCVLAFPGASSVRASKLTPSRVPSERETGRSGRGAVALSPGKCGLRSDGGAVCVVVMKMRLRFGVAAGWGEARAPSTSRSSSSSSRVEYSTVASDGTN